MSKSSGLAIKPNVFNDANENLYNPYAEEVVSPGLVELEYPDWSDAQLNAEVWDEEKTRRVWDDSCFQFLTYCTLPSAVQPLVKSWKRPAEIFSGANLTVYDPSNEDYTLKIISPGSVCSTFTNFIETISILQCLAMKYCFPVEFESPSFVSNTQGETWRPWHHIYALCKAGKGTVHRPQYNPYGQYVLRLFYMGSWRRFVVNDLIPCDQDGNCLLPVTQVPGELWPIILLKGVFRILLCPPHVNDIPYFTIFTGWIMCRINTTTKSYEEVWRRLVLLSLKYEAPNEDETDKNDLTAKGFDESDFFCYLMAHLKVPDEDGTKQMLVCMNRDSPLVKANKKESTKPWKKIRWVYWALEKGLWTDVTQLPPYRRIFCSGFTEGLGKFLLPDPKQESILYDLPVDEEAPPDDKPEDWYDYNKVYDYVYCLDVYFKPHCFNSNFKVSSLSGLKLPSSGKEMESAGKGKTTVKPLPTPTGFYFSHHLQRSCNEPPLLFCESTAGIFVCITFWICRTCHSGVLISNPPEFLEETIGSLLVEQFDWRKPEEGKIVGAIKSIGASSLGLSLKPGRHVFRLWINTNLPYVISVFSNTNFVIHKGPKIRFFLKNEAERILQYINNVSDAFISLTQRFGKPDLPESLRDFYSTIKPRNDAAPNYLKKMDEFIETFLYCILLLLKGVISNTEELKIMMGALQSLFFDLKINCELPKSSESALASTGKKTSKKTEKPELAFQTRSLSEIFSRSWSPDQIKKITRIQKIFRGYRARLLWKYQTPARKEFKLYAESLKKICDTIFSPAKREMEVGRLIRRILMINPNFLITFKFHEDFSNTIDVKEYTGRLTNVEPFSWVPMARFIIVCSSDSPVPCAFYLSCNLEQFVIQGIDNDTNEEIFRVVNCISPRYYQRNGKGYTIFAHGWNEAKTKTVNWRLEMVRMKYFDMLHLCNPTMTECSQTNLPPLEVLDLKNYYIPNHKSRICRCLIKIRQKTLFTLRLSTSYPEVSFWLTITLDKRFISTESGAPEEVVAKMSSNQGAAIMSAVFLEHFENPEWGESDVDYTLYILEAFVLKNSWPLTKHEWGVVEPFRVNGESWRDSSENLQLRKGMNESRRRLSRVSRRASNEVKLIGDPFWLLQVIPEFQGTDPQCIVIEEDKSFSEYVKNMKYQWEEKDPGRRSRGNDLRMNFLHQIWLETKTLKDEGEGGFEVSRPEDEDNHADFKLLMRRMSHFSYLLEDVQPQRFIKSPRIMPFMPTDELLLRYKKDVKISETSIRVNNESYSSSEENVNTTVEEIRDHAYFLTECKNYREVLMIHMNDELKLSNQLMEEAYEDRVKAIRRLSKMGG